MMFLTRLFRMLQDSQRKGFDSIVCWVGDTHFRIKDRNDFEKVVLPLYFESTKFTSFRRYVYVGSHLMTFDKEHLPERYSYCRQLNLYRFEYISDNRRGFRGCYTHPHFSRKQVDAEAIHLMRRKVLTARRRKRTKGSSPKGSSMSATGLNSQKASSNPTLNASSAIVSPSTSQCRVKNTDSSTLSLEETFNLNDDPLDDGSSWLLEDNDPFSPIQPVTRPAHELCQQATHGPAANSVPLLPNWLAQVPHDIQDEIIATFGSVRP